MHNGRIGLKLEKAFSLKPHKDKSYKTESDIIVDEAGSLLIEVRTFNSIDDMSSFYKLISEDEEFVEIILYVDSSDGIRLIAFLDVDSFGPNNIQSLLDRVISPLSGVHYEFSTDESGVILFDLRGL